ncbi:hypothetical protein ElyMa_002150500 [Elysia marginata]|uniref:Uncharacterized protein n=1 Tax=Elysia marginata TaxID=1093978 RepID=A0AAV4FL08_9GAST|nr:hypothetical protein ElyMa_002150500 [Elysia marginata]
MVSGSETRVFKYKGRNSRLMRRGIGENCREPTKTGTNIKDERKARVLINEEKDGKCEGIRRTCKTWGWKDGDLEKGCNLGNEDTEVKLQDGRKKQIEIKI